MLWIAVCSASVSAAAGAHASTFPALAAQFVAESEARDPLFADGIGVHTYDDRLADYSPAGVAGRQAWLARWDTTVRAAERDAADAVERADAHELRDTIEFEQFEVRRLRPFATDPTLYTTVIGNAIYQLTSRSYAPEPVRLNHVAARLALIPAVTRAAERQLTHPSRVATQQAIDENGGAIDLVTNLPATSAIVRARPAALAALRAFDRFLRGPLLARSNGPTRVGAAVYDRELALVDGTDLTRAELIAHARSDLDATRAKMLALALPLDRRFFPALQADEKRPNAADVVVRRVLDRLANDHPDREHIFATARADVYAAERFLRVHPLVRLPVPDTLHVRPTPPFMAGVAGASLDAAGPFTPLAESFYCIDEIPKKWSPAHVRSYLRENNTYEMKMLSLHEAMPGHYVQIRYNNATPSLVRRIYGNGSFIEGWAVYVEGMVVDAGYGGNDPRLKLFQLKWRLREQANLLIDAGYHAEHMTKSQFTDLLVRRAFQEPAQAEAKWHRLELSHDQLSSYFIGLTAIAQARDRLRAKAGAHFSLATFNRALLAMGSVEPRAVQPILAAHYRAGEARSFAGRAMKAAKRRIPLQDGRIADASLRAKR